MARYERTDGVKSYYWEIEVDDRYVITRWGVSGGRPNDRTLEYQNAETAQRRRDVLVKQKLSRGYQRVGDEPPAARIGTGNPELEAAIAACPDNIEARMVYADWLMAQDATLGRLVALEVEHASTGDDALLSQIAKLRAQCTGEVGDRRTLQLQWRLGLIRRARLSVMGSGATMLGSVLGLPAARTLQALRLDTDGLVSPQKDRVALLRALGTLGPRHLTTVELHHRATGDDPDYGDAGEWWAGLPAFDTLLVASQSAAMPLPHAQLRVLGLEASRLEGWADGFAAPWPRLEHLVLDRMPVNVVTTFLGSLTAPRLTTLALHHVDLERLPWRQVLATSVGAQLRTLELVGPVPWTLRSLLDRLGERITVQWCGGPAPDAEQRPEAAPWLEVVSSPKFQVPW